MQAHEIRRMQRVDTPMGPGTVTATGDNVGVYLDWHRDGPQHRDQTFDACDIQDRTHAAKSNDDGSNRLSARLAREAAAERAAAQQSGRTA